MRRRKRGRGGEGESCPSVCACMRATVNVYVLTPGARPPSLLTLWRALCLSGPFFTSLSSPSFFLLFPPFIFCPRLSAFFIPRFPHCFSSPPCSSNLILLFWISPTMVQDFCCPGRRGTRLAEVSRPIWARGWMDGLHECGIQL